MHFIDLLSKFNVRNFIILIFHEITEEFILAKCKIFSIYAFQSWKVGPLRCFWSGDAADSGLSGDVDGLLAAAARSSKSGHSTSAIPNRTRSHSGRTGFADFYILVWRENVQIIFTLIGDILLL